MPEKSSQQVSQSWRDLFKKGHAAYNHQNYDYAVSIFTQILEKEPAFYECREALRAAQFKKSGGGGGFFKKMLGTASSSPLLAKAQISIRKNPLEAIQTAEQVLNSDPSNSSAHRILAEAAIEADLPRTAVLSLEILFKNAPRDKKLALQLANALGRAGQVERASEILNDLWRAHPSDPEVAQTLKNVTAQKTLHESGYEQVTGGGQGNYRDLLRNKEEATILEQEKRVVKTEETAGRLIADYEARLAAEPNNLKIRRSLAELYTQKKEFDRALEYYQTLKESELGGDPSLDRAIAETTVRKYNHEIEQLNPADPTYPNLLAALKEARAAFQIEEARKRAEKFPNDLQIRYELGVLYFDTGRVNEAIQEFQRAQNHPQRRLQALGYLGKCFASKGVNDLALSTLQTAILERPLFDNEKKDLVYTYAGVLERLGRMPEAIEEYKKIWAVDIGYRDVAAKIDAYYVSSGGQG